MMRSVHFVPAHRQRFLDRIADLDVDQVVLELEDGVGDEDKDAARGNMAAFLRGVDAERFLVRINAVDSGHWEADRQVLANLEVLPGIVIPKVECAGVVEEVLSGLGAEGKPVRVIAMIESFAALGIVSEVARLPEVVAVGIGMEDLLAGTIHGPAEVRHLVGALKSEVVLAAKAEGVAAIDTISTEIRDDDAFRADCLESRAHGFDGRFVIHPAQIGVANEVYGPSVEMVEWARQVEAATGLDDTAGYRSIGGEVYSPPKVLKARKILEATSKQSL